MFSANLGNVFLWFFFVGSWYFVTKLSGNLVMYSLVLQFVEVVINWWCGTVGQTECKLEKNKYSQI